MKYNFEILTTQGMIESQVDSEYNFNGAPFGYVGYRALSSCTLDQAIIDDFWRCVDEVLAAHDLGPENFSHAVRTYLNGELIGFLPEPT